MRTQLKDYGFDYNKIPLYCDSQSTIAISCNLMQHSHTKDIDVYYKFIKEHVKHGTVGLYFVRTEYQLADMFMKALSQERFKTIITGLKAFDEGYSSKNYVRKFRRALHPKWRAKVTTIKESKDLISLSLDELIRNPKVYKMITKKDSEIVKAKGERKSLALKAKKEYSDEESLTSGSKDDEYAMGVRDFKKFFKRRECLKPSKEKNQRAFVEGSWSDSGEEDDEKNKEKMCLMAQASSE
nr:ribonuclease H [Tanacetum cinerariifolium]